MFCKYVCRRPPCMRHTLSTRCTIGSDHYSCIYQSPDGKRVAMSSETGQVYLFDVASSSLTSTYTSHAMAVRSLAWSPDANVCRSPSPVHGLTPRRCLFPHRKTSASSCTTSGSPRQASPAPVPSRHSPVTLHGCSAWTSRLTPALHCRGTLTSSARVSIDDTDVAVL